EAAEQSRRTAPPEILDPVKLKEALAGLHDPNIPAVIPSEDSTPSGGLCGHPDSDLQIVLAESEREVSLIDALRAAVEVKSLALAIGAEGGWTEEELRSFATLHWTAASLGETILRAETAAISAVAIARAEFP
ncbi:MAG: RsmE family RNA methyltransferase, partial [Candidatus Korobacteraceae bacterium]